MEHIDQRAIMQRDSVTLELVSIRDFQCGGIGSAVGRVLIEEPEYLLVAWPSSIVLEDRSEVRLTIRDDRSVSRVLLARVRTHSLGNTSFDIISDTNSPAVFRELEGERQCQST